MPQDEQTWTTEQLRKEFEVKGFSMGFVVVRRKADDVIGSMTFGGQPRLYRNFVEDKP